MLEHNSELVKEWHPYKNENYTPNNTSLRSDIKLWWLGTCGHEWKVKVRNKNNNKDTGFPICAGNVKKTIEDMHASSLLKKRKMFI